MAMAPDPIFSDTGNGYNYSTSVGDFGINADIYNRYLIHDGMQITANKYYDGASKGDANYTKAGQLSIDAADFMKGKYALTPEDAVKYLALGKQNDDGGWASKALNDQYGQGTAGAIADARGLKSQQDAKKNRGFAGKLARKAIPLAIGGGLSFLGGAALAPLFAGGGAAAAGAATGAGAATAPTSAALLAAPSGLGAGAGFSATALGSGAGLGTTLSGAITKGALKGGLSSLVQGGDFGDVLKGAATGGITSGAGSYLNSSLAALGGSGGLGDILGNKTVQGALKGGAGSLLKGGTGRDVLLGAAGGGLGSYLDDDEVLGEAVSPTSEDLLNAPTGGLESLTTGGSSMGLGNLLNFSNLSKAADLYGAYSGYKAQGDAEDRLREAQEAAAAQIQPYNEISLGAQQDLASRLEAGFEPGDLTSDPGYQFQMDQGNQMLDRRLSSSGGLDSGRALKAAQEYGQGVANQTYNEAYNRYLADNQQLASLGGQGLGAAGGLANAYGNIGNIEANAGVNKNNILTGALSDLLKPKDDNEDILAQILRGK